jgi:hypothetical protein
MTPGSPAAQPWQRDFPLNIRDVVAAAATGHPAPASTASSAAACTASSQPAHARHPRP